MVDVAVPRVLRVLLAAVRGSLDNCDSTGVRDVLLKCSPWSEPSMTVRLLTGQSSDLFGRHRASSLPYSNFKISPALTFCIMKSLVVPGILYLFGGVM